VWRDGEILSRAYEHMQRGQDARLMPMIVAVVEQAKVAFSEFDKIAVTSGPGSFTGVRVGLAAARGIGLAAHKPVIGINRFALYHSQHANTGQNILVVIDSKRVDLFCQYFPLKDTAHNACLMTQEQVAGFLADHPNTLTVGDTSTPDTELTSACAKFAAQADSESSEFLPRPLYLRAPDVHLPTGKSAASIAQ
jgi:tRNA threonylcarbamoyladenosine biosynthesis protein TsaB